MPDRRASWTGRARPAGDEVGLAHSSVSDILEKVVVKEGPVTLVENITIVRKNQSTILTDLLNFLYHLSLCVQDCDPLAGNLYYLRVPVPRQVLPRGNRGQPLPLSPLLTAHINAPHTFNVRCQTATCPGFNSVSNTDTTLDKRIL